MDAEQDIKFSHNTHIFEMKQTRVSRKSASFILRTDDYQVIDKSTPLCLSGGISSNKNTHSVLIDRENPDNITFDTDGNFFFTLQGRSDNDTTLIFDLLPANSETRIRTQQDKFVKYRVFKDQPFHISTQLSVNKGTVLKIFSENKVLVDDGCQLIIFRVA